MSSRVAAVLYRSARLHDLALHFTSFASVFKHIQIDRKTCCAVVKQEAKQLEEARLRLAKEQKKKQDTEAAVRLAAQRKAAEQAARQQVEAEAQKKRADRQSKVPRQTSTVTAKQSLEETAASNAL